MATTYTLRLARVLHVEEDTAGLWAADGFLTAGFAPMFPGPRTERVSPGHLVALATAPGAAEVIVWRWYDAVVLGASGDDGVRLWEPAHGEVTAHRRPSYTEREPGSRAYASAGLPGADWWVTGPADVLPRMEDVDLREVDAFFTGNELWVKAFTPDPSRS